MTFLRTGLLVVTLAVAAVVVPVAGAASLKETQAQVPSLETFSVTTDAGAQVSPQAAVNPADVSQRVVVASELRAGQDPRTAVWRWTPSGWVRSFLPAAGADGPAAPDVVWGPGATTWVTHVGEDAGPCAASSGVYLSSATYGGAWTSTLILGNLANPTFPMRFGDVSAIRDMTTGKAVVAAEAVTGAAGCGAGASEQRIAVAAPYAPGDGLPLVPTLPAPGNSPTLAPLPADGLNQPRVMLGFVSITGDVVVSRCTFIGAWNCLAQEEFDIVTPSTLSNGGGPAIPVGPSPDLARGPDGRLHLVYTAIDGGNADVFYTVSGDDGTTWSTPQSVADPEAESADQFLGTVAVTPALSSFPGGRVDIAFLDRRADGVRMQPFSTSYAIFDKDLTTGTVTRARNRALDGTPRSAPVFQGQAAVGERLAVAALGVDLGFNEDENPKWPTLAWWTDTAESTAGDLVNAKLNHGSAPPTLPTSQVTTPKNVSVNVPDLLATSDQDGDPVRVALASLPTYGVLNGLTYVPHAGFAGQDGVYVYAEDGYANTTSVMRPLTVTNQQPRFTDLSTVVNQGSRFERQLEAQDGDFGDTRQFALVSVDQRLSGSVDVTPEGKLTVDLPDGLRASSNLIVRVRVSDSSPAQNGWSDGVVQIKINPDYVPISVDVKRKQTGTAVKFIPKITDLDPERMTRVATYQWRFGDQTPASVREQPVHRYRPGRYQWSLTVFMPRNETINNAPITLTGTVEIKPTGASFVTMTQRLDKKRRQLVVRLRSTLSGDAALAVRAGKRSVSMKAVPLKANRVRVVRVPLKRLGNARSGTLSMRFTTNRAATPDPMPLNRLVRLR